MLTWLTFWSSEIINKFRARNGRTAYELMTGHRVRHLMIGFGEKIMGQFTADKTSKNDHDTRWFEAFFLGVETCSGSYLVVNSDGIFKIANIRRLPDENAYDDKILKDVTKTFADYVSKGAAANPVRTTVVIGVSSANPDPLRSGPVPRRAMLRRADFTRFGLTAGCAGCQWIANPTGQSRNHTEECRMRIETELAGTEDGKAQIQKAKDRIDTKMAEIIEDHSATHDNRDEKEGKRSSARMSCTILKMLCLQLM